MWVFPSQVRTEVRKCVPSLPGQFTVSVLVFTILPVTRGLRRGDDGGKVNGCAIRWDQSRHQRAFPVLADTPGDSPAGDPGTIL